MSAPLFHGKHGEQEGKGVSPQDFWSLMETMRGAAPPGTTDAAFIQQVASYFRDDARQWMKVVLKGRLGEADYRATLNNWNLFGQQFKLAFYDLKNAKDQTQHWMGMKQTDRENASRFANRAYAAIAENSEMWRDYNIARATATAPNPQAYNPALNAILEAALDTPDSQTMFQGYIAAVVKHTLEYDSKVRDVHYTAALCSGGLKDPRLRTYAVELNKRDVNIAQFLDAMSMKEEAFNINNKPANKATVNEVTATPQEVPSETGASAAGPKKKKSNAKKNKPKSKPPKDNKPTGPPKTPCMFCGQMHRHKECPVYSTARRLNGLEATDATEAGNE